MKDVNKQIITFAAEDSVGQANKQSRTKSEQLQGRALRFEDPHPWPEPVDLASVLRDLVTTLRRYVAFSEEAATAVALWVVFTYAFDAAYIAPMLAICSPEKRCGKSTLLQLLQASGHRPLLVANITGASLFRIVERYTPTLLIDEADTFLDTREELHGIINSGEVFSKVVDRVT